MTLHTPDATWPWPDVDVIVDLVPLTLVPWRRRGDSYKLRAFDPDSYERQGSRARPRYLIKYGQDAVAECLTYLVHRAVDLPFQHVFWGALGDATVVAIPFVPDAVPTKRLHRSPDGMPYVNFNRRRVPVINERDRNGHTALGLLFDDLDGMETMVDPHCSLFFRVDGAAGHLWADAFNLVEVTPSKEDEFIRRLRLQYTRVGTEWLGDEVARSVIRAGAEQKRENLYAGPNVARAVEMIISPGLFDDARRSLMLTTLGALAACESFAEEVRRNFQAAPGEAARALADGLAVGLAAMFDALQGETLLNEHP